MRFVAVVKEDCPTCRLAVPALADMRSAGLSLEVVTQDNPAFPADLAPRHDADLAESHRLGIEIVPTVVAYDEAGRETDRVFGWNMAEWRALSGLSGLGAGLPENMPGCGALNVMPGMAEKLALASGDLALASREIAVAEESDPHEVKKRSMITPKALEQLRTNCFIVL